MQVSSEMTRLMEISVEQIDRNPENPRLVFRSPELEDLLESIRRYGVQVPISVYKSPKRFVLIDGERRWRCCLKLNKKTIPALVQEKPDPLTNLLLMFNIHALREQWDLLTIALKLPRVIDLLEKKLGKRPNERELAEETGLSRGLFRRCKLLMDLPQRYRDELLKELNKPKPEQLLTEDLFIEMERSLKTVQRSLPSVIDDKDRVRQVLLAKYQQKVIRNITDFRNMAKIARAERVSADTAKASTVLRRLFEPNEYSIESAYRDSVGEAYTERDLLTRIKGLLEQLEDLTPTQLDEDMVELLRELMRRVDGLLRASHHEL